MDNIHKQMSQKRGNKNYKYVKKLTSLVISKIALTPQ